MARRPLDPRITNITVDANVLDKNGTARDKLVDEFDMLASKRILSIVVAGGVREEVSRPQTPQYVQQAMLPRVFNLRAGLNGSQQADRNRVRAVLQGNARPDKHAADASHLSEAVETGCAYFITEDKRVLAKRDELRSVTPPSLWIVSLAEFLEIFNRFARE